MLAVKMCVFLLLWRNTCERNFQRMRVFSVNLTLECTFFLIWMFGRGFFPVRLFFLVCDTDGVLTQTDDMPNGMFLFTKHYG